MFAALRDTAETNAPHRIGAKNLLTGNSADGYQTSENLQDFVQYEDAPSEKFTSSANYLLAHGVPAAITCGTTRQPALANSPRYLSGEFKPARSAFSVNRFFFVPGAGKFFKTGRHF
jgi:hypothetical protein